MKRKNGFTFIEVMVTVMILATGIVMIYKVFLSSLDHQRYLIHRLYANNVLDQKIEEMQRLFKEKGEESLQQIETVENVFLRNKEIAFTTIVLFENVPGLKNILQMDVGVSWPERGRPIHLARSVYIVR